MNVADCDDPAAYIDHVAALPAIETLVVGGSAFTDEHLKRLHGLTTLSGLVLDCTEVTDEGLAALAQALPSLEAYQSERRAIALQEAEELAAAQLASVDASLAAQSAAAAGDPDA